MTYKINFEKAAIKFLEKQNNKQQERILKAIYILPDGTDIKKLQGYDLKRLRIGDTRIIFSINEEEKIITIVNIDSRGYIYKRY